MNNFWSEKVQGVNTLYLSRKLRFNDIFKKNYMDLFRLEPHKKLRILEVGCGPGALAEALHRWYPEAEIFAVDRDSRFIEFAKERIAGATFIESDIAALPFGDEEFNVTVSNTVSEHIVPDIFYSEQRRVLKKGGICIVISARKGINRIADCLNETDEENRFWESAAGDSLKDLSEKYGVGKYAANEKELPITMEKRGFTNVSSGYIITPFTPDNPDVPPSLADEIFEAQRQSAIEAILSACGKNAAEAVKAVNAKFDKRIKLYKNGVRQWDTYISAAQVVRGVKE